MLQKIINRFKILTNYFRLMKVYTNTSHAYSSDKIVFFNLKDIRLEAYYYPLIYFFSKSGYTIHLNRHIWFIGHAFNAGRFIYELPNLKIGKPSEDERKIIFIFDDKAGKLAGNWKKSIQLNTNIYNNKTDNNENLVFPFSMHANMYHLGLYKNIEQHRLNQRQVKILFSGNCNQKAYNSEIFNNFFKLLNRYETINIIKEKLQDDTIIIKEEQDYDLLSSDTFINKFVLMDWTWSPSVSKNLKARIPTEEWLRFLAKSDFFLACVGITMPMSHNVIEAMSVGTIPIIEYNDYFYPPLTHMKNAIVFEGKEDLIEKMKVVFELPSTEINHLRKNVIQYYENYHKPEAFCKTVETFPKKELSLYLYTTGVSYDSYHN